MSRDRIRDLLQEARSTLEMWKDVAPAVSLCRDIDKALAEIPSPPAGDVLRAGATIYELNSRGVNRWDARVQPGRTEEGERTTDAECEAVAERIHSALASPSTAPTGHFDMERMKKALSGEVYVLPPGLNREQQIAVMNLLGRALAAAPAAPAWTNEQIRSLWQTTDTGDFDDDIMSFAQSLLAAAPVVEPTDRLPREEFASLVVQEACETEPADADDPETIKILARDLKSAVLSAFLRADAASHLPTPGMGK